MVQWARSVAVNGAAGDSLVAVSVANTQADLLQLAVLKDPNEQRHGGMIPEPQPIWAANREAR
jgi:hypothetical protein